MANTFSRWVPATFTLFDTQAKLKLRAFNKREAPAFKAAVAKRFGSIAKKEGETDKEHEERAQILLKDWLALAKDSFSKWVRLEETLKDADSGTEITTGAELYDEAPGDFVIQVMLKLAELASLGDTEGNAYGSPSTSTVEAGPDSTESPATTTDATASPKLSIAPETNSGAVPFSRPA